MIAEIIVYYAINKVLYRLQEFNKDGEDYAANHEVATLSVN